MSDWAQRLQRLQAAMPQPEVESIDHLSLSTLKDETVKFGKAHMGKTYQELWETSQPWIKWFLLHYQSSMNLEHRKVIRFIKLKIEETESQGSGNQQLPVNPRAKAAPKSLIAATKSRPAPHPEVSAETDMPEEPWIDHEMGTVGMQDLQDRMTNLENALHQILVHLTPSTNSTTPPTSMGAELPVLPLVSEWEDPWGA